MPPYLAEVYCKEDQARLRIDYWRSFRWFSARCDTQSQTLASNEEAKIILVLDIQDHSLTFAPFGGAIAQGFFARRRLTPLVDWSTVASAVKDTY